MQTGQNSIAPENSLPQLGQVRWGSVLMALTALQPQPESKAKPRSAEWCESGQQGPWQTVVPFHKLVRFTISAASSDRNEKHQIHRDIRRQYLLNQDPENFGPPKGTPDKERRFNSADFLKLGLSHAFVS